MNPIKIILIACLTFSISVLSYAAAGGGNPPQYFVDETKLPFEALPGATAYYGVHKGAGYRIEVPENWNGDLVVYAHGYRGTGLELTVDNAPLRPLLIQYGYAWAASSYSRNDYDIQTGVQDTHAITTFFNGIAGKPNKVYLMGASMGGHITAVALEQYKNTYDAGLPFCGAIGGYALFDYFVDFNVAAQQLGLGESAYPVEPATYLGVTTQQIKSNLEAFPGGWPVALNAAGQNLKNLTENLSGGERPNFDEAWYYWNIIPVESGSGNFMFERGIGDGTSPRAPGFAIDNSDTVYQFDSDPALSDEEILLNADVVRVSSGPRRGHQGLAQMPVVNGDINVPVLTLHNLGDLFVPVLNEVEYAKRVAANGKSDLLVQRAIRGVEHCDFTAEELATAFIDLVSWVEYGVKPAGDNFLDKNEMASPDFGCQHTNGTHLLGTACP